MQTKTEILTTGSLVRIVSMNGCMAHVRGKIRAGQVVGFVDRNIYDGNPGGRKTRMALIHLHDGEMVERPAEARLWTWYENRLEYHE